MTDPTGKRRLLLVLPLFVQQRFRRLLSFFKPHVSMDFAPHPSQKGGAAGRHTIHEDLVRGVVWVRRERGRLS